MENDKRKIVSLVFYLILIVLISPFLIEIVLGARNVFLGVLGDSRASVEEGLMDERSRVLSLLNIFTRSFVVATLTLVLSFILSFVLKRNYSGRQITILLSLLTIPFLVSESTRSYSWSVFLGGDGPINTLMLNLGLIHAPISKLANNEIAVYCVMIVGCTPLAVMIQLISLNSISDNIWLASQDLGMSHSNEFLRIAIPLSKKGLFTSWAMAFLLSLSMSTEVASLGGSSKESLRIITTSLSGADKLYAILSLAMVMMVVTLLFGITYWLFFERKAMHKFGDVSQ